MAEFYILLPDDNPNDIYDVNILGRESFGTFYAERGMKSLMTILEKHPEVIGSTTIITETGKELSITEFIDKIGKLKVLFN